MATTGQIVSADPLPWVNATIAALYGIDTATADALQYMLRDGIYEGFVPDYLVGLGSDGVYKTQTVNQWLFGWFDPISAGADDPTAPEAGWTNLRQTKPTMVLVESQPGLQQLTQYVLDTTLTATREKLCLKTVLQNSHGTAL